MAISIESPAAGVSVCTESRRAGRELVLEWVFQPLSSLLVPVLARLRVPPPAVVVANTVAGLLAALAIVGDGLIAGALLLQAKTLLDNCDGRLARATGSVSLAGRYLDTVADLVVNAALFLALGYVTREPLLALAAFLAMTLVLAADFNVSEQARERHGDAVPSPRPTGSPVERFLGSLYGTLFAPQDRAVRAISRRRFERAVGVAAPTEAQRAYFDPLTLAVLANLGLTTQLLLLGVCLVLGVPALYLWLTASSVIALVPLQLRRERLASRVAAGR